MEKLVNFGNLDRNSLGVVGNFINESICKSVQIFYVSSPFMQKKFGRYVSDHIGKR